LVAYTSLPVDQIHERLYGVRVGVTSFPLISKGECEPAEDEHIRGDAEIRLIAGSTSHSIHCVADACLNDCFNFGK
jgi:hypothetical protein